MRGFSIIWRAIRDTFDQILTYMLGSILWWVAVFVPFIVFAGLGSALPTVVGEAVLILGIIIGASPATTLLSRWVDPRLVVDRPSWRDLGPWFRQYARTSWIVGAFVFTALGILLLNLAFYAQSGSVFTILVPLWLFLIVIGVIVAFTALALVSLTDATPRQAFRRAGYVIASAPIQSLLLAGWILVTILLGVALIVPLILLTPPLIMAATNRLILNQLQIAIPDPNAPTDERVVERTTGDGNPDKGRRGGGFFNRG